MRWPDARPQHSGRWLRRPPQRSRPWLRQPPQHSGQWLRQPPPCTGLWHRCGRGPGLLVSFLLCLCWALVPGRLTAAPFTPCPEGLLALTVQQTQACVEVAKTDPERARGLMFRQELGRDRGMVFVFGEDGLHRMWMKNTLVPLSVAFLDADGVILNIEDMQAQTLTPHGASGAARYALEMPLGWFVLHDLGPGLPVQGLPPPSAAR